MLAAGVGVIVVEGGDAFWAFRFLVPLLPLLYYLVQEGVFEASGRVRGRLGATLLAAAFAAGAALHVGHMARDAQREARGADEFTTKMKRVGEALREHLPPTATIAINASGAVPFVSGLRTIDMLGINDAHIAHRPLPLGRGLAGHEKADARYVLSRRPDVILLGGVTVVPDRPSDLSGVAWKLKNRSERTLAARPELGRRYEPDALPLGDGRYVVFMRRRDFELPAGASDAAR